MSFGTNDLTQMTYGFSRDDVEASVIKKYIEMDILQESPFAQLDALGVGKLVQEAINSSRAINPEIKLEYVENTEGTQHQFVCWLTPVWTT